MDINLNTGPAVAFPDPTTLWVYQDGDGEGAYIVRRGSEQLVVYAPNGYGWWDAKFPSGQERHLWEPHTEQDETEAALRVAWRLMRGPT
jgi:hypothetical protein